MKRALTSIVSASVLVGFLAGLAHGQLMVRPHSVGQHGFKPLPGTVLSAPGAVRQPSETFRKAVDAALTAKPPAPDKFEVWYTTGSDGQQWILAYNGLGQNLSTSWDEAHRIAGRLGALGFESNIATYRATLYVRTGTATRKQLFKTLDEAKAFRAELRSLTNKDVGLHVRISEL